MESPSKSHGSLPSVVSWGGKSIPVYWYETPSGLIALLRMQEVLTLLNEKYPPRLWTEEADLTPEEKIVTGTLVGEEQEPGRVRRFYGHITLAGLLRSARDETISFRAALASLYALTYQATQSKDVTAPSLPPHATPRDGVVSLVDPKPVLAGAATPPVRSRVVAVPSAAGKQVFLTTFYAERDGVLVPCWSTRGLGKVFGLDDLPKGWLMATKQRPICTNRWIEQDQLEALSPLPIQLPETKLKMTFLTYEDLSHIKNKIYPPKNKPLMQELIAALSEFAPLPQAPEEEPPAKTLEAENKTEVSTQEKLLRPAPVSVSLPPVSVIPLPTIMEIAPMKPEVPSAAVFTLSNPTLPVKAEAALPKVYWVRRNPGDVPIAAYMNYDLFQYSGATRSMQNHKWRIYLDNKDNDPPTAHMLITCGWYHEQYTRVRSPKQNVRTFYPGDALHVILSNPIYAAYKPKLLALWENLVQVEKAVRQEGHEVGVLIAPQKKSNPALAPAKESVSVATPAPQEAPKPATPPAAPVSLPILTPVAVVPSPVALPKILSTSPLCVSVPVQAFASLLDPAAPKVPVDSQALIQSLATSMLAQNPTEDETRAVGRVILALSKP